MKKILAFITFLLFLLLLWCANNKYQACCDSNSNVIEKAPIVTKREAPLVYKWNSSEAITNDLWDARKIGILSELTDNKILRILGPYFEEEGKALGITRAKSAFAKLDGKVDSTKVEFDAKLVDFYDSAKTSYFSGTEFKWLTRNENIQEIDNKTRIYFPSNSTKKVSNSNILDYLISVVEALEGNTKTVALSGHTDNVGNPVFNKKLALGRANSIKVELVRLGINPDRISVVSFGEEKPIATNETKAGKQQNRRVELEIK